MNVLTGLITGMISGATPILLAALGGSFTYFAGVFNIAMEGMMLTGAFFAVWGSYTFHSWFIGILLGILGSLGMALIFILFAVVLKTDEFITGIALNLFAAGASVYLLRQIFDVKGAFSNPGIIPIPALNIPLIEQIPFLGAILSGHNLIIYLALLATFLCNYLIFHTTFGLRLRAAGYQALSLESSGVASWKMRTASLLLCGLLCGLAGAYISLGYVNLFVENMSAGKGWIALAAIILVGGKPWGIALVSLVFGFFDGLGLYLQGTGIAPQFTAMVPYVATLIALYFYSTRKKPKRGVEFIS
jgi:simple sugar transport system permease protein